MSLKACGGITAPMLPVKQETEAVRVRCQICPGFVKQKESELPEKPSIWKRNCRGERYAQFPPVYEEDQQTGVLTQKLIDEYGLIPQDILRSAIALLYKKVADKERQQEESAAQDVDDVGVRDPSIRDRIHYDDLITSTTPTQTVKQKWRS